VNVANAIVERIHIAPGASVLQAHLFVNAGIYHCARQGAGHVDIGVNVTVFYRSNGKLVALQSQRTKVAPLEGRPVDAQTVRVMVQMPFGAQKPDPDTTFTGRAQLVVNNGSADLSFG
jgi:hypothetical protein